MASFQFVRNAQCAASFGALLLIASPFAEASPHRGSYVRMEKPPEALDGHDEGLPRILYLNRCAGGCTITPGNDDAINNTSGIVAGTSFIAEFPYGDEAWNQIVECVRDQYSLFNINVTDVDPGTTPHFESIVAGYAEDIGAGGAGGIAPFACDVWPNSINFTFAETLGNNPQILCEVAAQESGHVMGLDHAYLCEDPMTYLDGCGAKTFQNQYADCGEFQPRACDCGNPQQNSVQHLLDIFGPGNVAPTANVSITAVTEDPNNSDGNAVASPGESLLIDVHVENVGNASTDEVSFALKSSGHLRLTSQGEPLVLGAGLSADIQLVAEVRPSACGREVEFTVETELEDGQWSDSSTLTFGINPATWTSDLATDEPWEADDGADATQGAWEYGVPEQTIFAGRIVQPGGGSAGDGTPIWTTGLAGEWDASSLVGRSVLETSNIPQPDWHTVTGLHYRLWHLAYDRRTGGLDPSEDAHLIVELSTNKGASWTEIDRVIGEEYRWQVREVEFEPIQISSEVRLRFIAENSESVETKLIEVGIDQIALQGGELSCVPTDGGGCGCSSTGGGAATWWPWLAVFGLFGLRRLRLAGRPFKNSGR